MLKLFWNHWIKQKHTEVCFWSDFYGCYYHQCSDCGWFLGTSTDGRIDWKSK